VRHSEGGAVSVDFANPVKFHEPPLALLRAFASGDDPVERIQIRTQVDGFEKWLCRNETDRCRKLSQLFDPSQRLVAAGCRAQPDVGISVTPVARQSVLDQFRSLGENQPVERFTLPDDVPGFVSPGIGSGMKEVGHRARKHSQPSP
jgi:hypothetical protein